jgi:hypothetical protein
MHDYCAGKHWSLDWMEEHQTATYLRSFGKAFAHMRNCLLKKIHMAQAKTLTDSTRKRHKKEIVDNT